MSEKICNQVDRIDKLKEAMLPGSLRNYDADLDVTAVQLGDTRDEPLVIGRAKAMGLVLTHMPIYIRHHELIVRGQSFQESVGEKQFC